MIFWVLQVSSNRIVDSLSRYAVGRRTGSLLDDKRRLLLFSNEESAIRFQRDRHIDFCRLVRHEEPLAPSLADIAAADSVSSVRFPTGADIGIFSCTTGGLILPGHFLRFTETGVIALCEDDRWVSSDFHPDSPMCSCGARMIPFIRNPLPISQGHHLPFFFDVRALNFDGFTGRTIGTSIALDLDVPKSEFQLSLRVRFGRDELIFRSGICPESYSIIESPEGPSDPVEWDISPFTGLVRISYFPIHSSTGATSLEISTRPQTFLLAWDQQQIPYLESGSCLEFIKQYLELLNTRSGGTS